VELSSFEKNIIPHNRDAISLWRVCLPSDVDRDVYISSCFSTNTISVIDEFGERQNEVRIGSIALQQVVFPLNESEVGSEVLCASLPHSGLLYVIDVYGGDHSNLTEHQHSFRKSIVGGFANVLIDGQGRIVISVDSDSDSEVFIQSTGGKSGKITIRSTTQVLIDSPKILLNDSEEPIILGNKLVDLLTELFDQLGIESAGPYPLLGNQFYLNLKEKLEALKSTLSFVK